MKNTTKAKPAPALNTAAIRSHDTAKPAAVTYPQSTPTEYTTAERAATDALRVCHASGYDRKLDKLQAARAADNTCRRSL